MRQVNFKKIKEYKNGATLEFRYKGVANDVFDEEKAEKILEAFFSREELLCNMERNISYIRTILKDTEEKILAVKYNDSKNMENVQYMDKILYLFECKKYDNESLNYMEVEFTPSRGLRVSFSDLENDCIIEYPQSEIIKDKFGKIVEHIKDLRDAGFVYIDNDSKILIEIYKLFYNENPDFSKDDINIKMQAMVSILAQFDICCGDYFFDFHKKMPESLALSQKVENLFPLGEITIIDDPLELKKSAKEYIGIVGKTLREALSNEKNINESLIAISKSIYAGRYDILYYDINELMKCPNINLKYSEVESSLKLVKKIKDRMFENM